MYKHLSPLRYPGGKTSLWSYLRNVIEENRLSDVTYIEPFAGGAGAALNLLVNGYVREIVLNDLDKRIYKFWSAILNHHDEFIAKIVATPVSVKEWGRQKNILHDKKIIKTGSDVEVGFASFYLNRCNRSGILSSGPIGGLRQDGNWKIDARFNKIELIHRIEKIAQYKSRIKLYNQDGVKFLEKYLLRKSIQKDNLLVYLDPPYYQQGRDLYKYYMEGPEHKKLGEFLKKHNDFRWIVSYDDIAFIRNIYRGIPKNYFEMRYSIHSANVKRELLISSENCILPKM